LLSLPPLFAVLGLALGSLVALAAFRLRRMRLYLGVKSGE